MSSVRPIAVDKPRAARLEARVTDEQKALLQRAADMSGRTLTEFVVASAQEAAMKVLREHDVVRLVNEDRAVFLKALLAPAEPGKRLNRAAARYRKAMGV